MKKIIGLFILFTVMACSPATEQSDTDTQTSESKETEVQQVQLGEVSINLPHINGMTESYSHPVAKEFADKFNVVGNTILAYYLNNETYKRVDKLGTFKIDDYFQILIPDMLIDQKVDPSELDGITNEIVSIFGTEKWDELEKDNNKELNEVLDKASIGKTVMIEEYSPHNDTKTIVTLMKLQTGGKQESFVMMMNIIIVKERLLSLNYYVKYQGEASIKTAKAKNDDIVLQLLNANK